MSKQGTDPLTGGGRQAPREAAARRRSSRTAEVGARVGEGLSRGTRAAVRGTGAAVRGTGAAGRATFRATRRATQAQGAGESGLSRLIEMHALHNAGDAVVAVSLAGTLFFTVPTGEAREQVALFLLLTLLPFGVLAPFVAPLLDRLRHGRRWAIGSTMALRAFLCWLLASSVHDASWWQFPTALGILVASKAYNVTRAAATPRVLPAGMGLVTANGRMSLAGVVGATVAASLAVAAAQAGPEWSLRLGFLVFVAGTVLAVLLPARVDSARGEAEVPLSEVVGRRRRRTVPPEVLVALRANGGLRMLSGFLTIYLAFLLRAEPPPGWDHGYAVLLGVVVVAAGLGSATGTVVGSTLRAARPLFLVTTALVVDVVVAVLTAVQFGMVSVVLLCFVVGLCQQVGKLALDASIQEHVPERTRTSVFGRSETLIQLSWVLGGALGIALPTDPAIGLGVVAGVLVLWLLLVLRGARRARVSAAPEHRT